MFQTVVWSLSSCFCSNASSSPIRVIECMHMHGNSGVGPIGCTNIIKLFTPGLMMLWQVPCIVIATNILVLMNEDP